MKVKVIRVKIPGKCSALKPLPGARFTGYYCQFKPKHKGPHSWEISAVLEAAKNADWGQVVMNQGPPCFHIGDDDGRFCFRAQRWAGHDETLPHKAIHSFVSLHDFLSACAAVEG